MSALPSCSALERADSCRASSVLPKGPDRGSEDADRGTALHAYVEAVANGADPSAALALVPEQWRNAARSLDVGAILEALGWDPFGDQTMTAEEAFAWDPATDAARSLGCGLDRDYSGAAEREAVGTADVVLFDRAARRVVIADYKFGHGHVTRAAENLQVRSLALYAARHYGATSAHVVLIRGREDGSVWLDRADLEERDLATVAADLRDLASQIASDRMIADDGGVIEATPGEHCRYCSAAPSCPLGPMALAVADGIGFAPLRRTAEGRAKLLQLRVLARKLPDLIDAELRDAIEAGDTALPGGQELAIETTEKKKVGDADAVHAAVLAAHGETAANIAAPLERYATLTTIKAAAKVYAAKGKATAEGDALVADLFAVGAVKVSTSESIVARKAVA